MAVSDIDPVGMKRDEITEHVANKKRALKELQAKSAKDPLSCEAFVFVIVESRVSHFLQILSITK